MELIHPVAAGPVLDEKELQASRLSPEQQRVIRAMFDLDADQDVTEQELDNVIEGARAMAGALEQSFRDLERYEEALVPKGHHPVHKEDLHGEDEPTT